MRNLCFCVALVFGITVIGCGGSDKITLPTDKLTAEQVAKIKIEDANIDNEESHGKKKTR